MSRDWMQETAEWLFHGPLWFSSAAIFAFLSVAYLAGRLIGLRELRAHGEDTAPQGGNVTLGAMLALLGLLLAFTYSFALNRAEDRRVMLVEEINAIGTAFQWADLLPEPGRSEMRGKLRDYAATRAPDLNRDISLQEWRAIVEKSSAALAALWPALKQTLGPPPYGPVEAAAAASVIAVGDASTSRLAVAFSTIPRVVLGLLLAVAALALLLVAYTAAVRNRVSNFRAISFTLVLTALITLILDFDRPRRGFIRNDDSALRSLIESMDSELAGR